MDKLNLFISYSRVILLNQRSTPKIRFTNYSLCSKILLAEVYNMSLHYDYYVGGVRFTEEGQLETMYTFEESYCFMILSENMKDTD